MNDGFLRLSLGLQPFHRFPESKGHVLIPHLMNEGVHDFRIQKFQWPRAFVH